MTFTIAHLLPKAKESLTSSETASLDAQILLCEILGVDRTYLFAHLEAELTNEQTVLYQEWVERRAEGEPVAYIIGKWEFYDREFVVTPDVLIPRPETELLLEQAINFARGKDDMVAADIGTGSGALAITLAAHAPTSKVFATEISRKALDIAQQNADQNKVEIHFMQGNLAQPLLDADIEVDLLMANLPYIRREELLTLAVSEFEPHQALDGGEDGLYFIRELLTQVPIVCKQGALVLLEIGAEQGDAVTQYVSTALPNSQVEIIKDYAGLDRIVKIRLCL